MFPLRDDNPTFATPYGTYAIIALNVLVWVFAQGLGSPDMLAGSVCMLGLIPGELLHTVPAGTQVPVGPNMACVIGSASVWYTPLTSMFTHGGWLHIIGNMWFLYVFGDNVEDSMGTPRFLAFYLICGLAAAALQVAAGPNSPIPMVGASGAIGGVMGAYIVLFPKVRVHMLVFLGFFITRIAVPAYLMLGYWILVQLLSGVGSIGAQGGVAFWAHVGGFGGGALLIFLFRNPELLARHPYFGWGHKGRSSSESWRRIDRW